MKIRFLGAAGEVTGSCYLVETDRYRFMVDCGMFQGGRDAPPKNHRALGFDVRSIDFVLVTHAHIDHSGLIPRLSALGYRGPIHVTTATADLLAVMLLDSAHIQEKEAEFELRQRRARRGQAGSGTGPLYTVIQAQDSLRLLRAQPYDDPFEPAPGVRVVLRDAGHILGSAIAEVWVTDASGQTKFVFSGDLGVPGRPVVRDPTGIADADILLVESTYGNRLHKGVGETEAEVVEVLNDTLGKRHGNVVIPAFAVGRTQEVLVMLADLVRRKLVPPLRVYVDSPMATAATRITMRHLEMVDQETRELFDWQRDNPRGMQVRFIETVEESIALNDVHSGAIIISASGMCDAGRIKFHLAANLPRRDCAVLITGFQAQGSLGRRLVDGAKRVRIHGQEIPVKARIHTVGGLSAHADRANLLDWLGGFRQAPRQTFVVHGEWETAHEFARAIQTTFGWTNVIAPDAGQVFELPAGPAQETASRISG